MTIGWDIPHAHYGHRAGRRDKPCTGRRCSGHPLPAEVRSSAPVPGRHRLDWVCLRLDQV